MSLRRWVFLLMVSPSIFSGCSCQYEARCLCQRPGIEGPAFTIGQDCNCDIAKAFANEACTDGGGQILSAATSCTEEIAPIGDCTDREEIPLPLNPIPDLLVPRK